MRLCSYSRPLMCLWALLPLLLGQACSADADGGPGAPESTGTRDADPQAPSLEFDQGPMGGGVTNSGGSPTEGDAGRADAGAPGGSATDADVGDPPDAPAPPPATQCANGLDDDGDGDFDVWDADCSGAADPTEQGDRPTSECGNGLDDDADGHADFPDDPGCAALGDGSEADPAGGPPECGDGIDNNDDGRTDFPEDPGCPGRGTPLEVAPARPPACADGQDNDADGDADYPDDLDCPAAAGLTEASVGGCGGDHHVVDLNRALAGAEFVDGDTSQGAPGFVGTCGGNAGPEVVFRYRVSEVVGALEFTTEFPETVVPTVLYVRSACDDPQDVGCNRGSDAAPGTHVRLERPAVGTYFVVVDTSMADLSGAFRLSVLTVEAPRCSDIRDNDQDGRIDLLDPGCETDADEDEADPPTPPECADGLDNDGDGQIDYPADATCHAAGGRQETEASCAMAPDLILMDAAGGMLHVSTPALPNAYTSTCGGNATGPEQVIAVVLNAPATISVVLSNNNGFDTVLHARTVCDDPATQLACDDDGAGGLASALNLANLQPGVYYIFVDGYGGDSGECDVTVSVQ